MDYRVLGPLEVRDGEESLPLAGAKQRALLAVLLFLPGLEYSHFIVEQIPAMRVSLEEYLRSQSSGLPATAGEGPTAALRWQAFAVAVLGALCEELAFRGFILSGLRRRFKPWMAVFVSSFPLASRISKCHGFSVIVTDPYALA